MKNEGVNKYQGELYIYPTNKSLEFTGEVEYYITEDNKDVIDVYIYRLLDLKIRSDVINKIEDVDDFKKIKFIPEAKVYRVYLHQKFNKGDKLNFDVEVKGIINVLQENTVNRISQEFVEIGIYASWFPVFDDLSDSHFEIKVFIDREYQIISTSVEQIDDYYLVKTIRPFNDLTIIGLTKPHILDYKNDDIELRIFSSSPEALEMSNKIAEYSKEIINLYLDKFGNLDTQVKLNIVLVDRIKGGGYCRENLMVLTVSKELTDEILFKYIAHELAHLWWYKANVNSYEDWLNESFAEYSALLAFRNKFGEEAFTEKIKKYLDLSKNLGPIINLQRDAEDAFMILYVKGPIILYNLHKKLDNLFDCLIRNIHQLKINSTKDLFDYLDNEYGKEIKDYLETMLN